MLLDLLAEKPSGGINAFGGIVLVFSKSGGPE